MSRIPFAACFALAVASSALLSAQQSRPDLSGRWAVVPDLSTPSGSTAFGTTLVIGQSADSITLDELTSQIHFPSGISESVNSETGGLMRAVYLLDGTDHDVPLSARTTSLAANAVVVSSSSIVAKSYRAVWAGKQLVIMTHDSLVFSRRNGDPIPIRRMIRQALTLGVDGSLVAESLILADPVPNFVFFNDTSGPEQPAPTPVRTVYRRAQ